MLKLTRSMLGLKMLDILFGHGLGRHFMWLNDPPPSSLFPLSLNWENERGINPCAWFYQNFDIFFPLKIVRCMWARYSLPSVVMFVQNTSNPVILDATIYLVLYMCFVWCKTSFQECANVCFMYSTAFYARIVIPGKICRGCGPLVHGFRIRSTDFHRFRSLLVKW